MLIQYLTKCLWFIGDCYQKNMQFKKNAYVMK